jgi:hypothetical protein
VTPDPPAEPSAQQQGAAHTGLIGALLFLLAGASTILCVVPVTGAATGQLVGMVGSLLTLGGLCLLAYGSEDERPLRHAPGAQPLLFVGAAAGVAQALVVFTGMAGLIPPTAAAVGAPVVGLLGGLAVGASTVLLVLRRPWSPNPARPMALAGLATIAAGAVAANVLWLAGAQLGTGPGGVGVLAAVVVTGVGELLIAAQFWRDGPRRAATRTRVRPRIDE